MYSVKQNTVHKPLRGLAVRIETNRHLGLGRSQHATP